MNLLANRKGFTFIELSIVMAIISILSAIAFVYFNDLFARGKDSSAVSDAISIITVVNNNFLDKDSINYEAISADGRNVGIEDLDGNPIPPAITLSPGVRCQFSATGGAGSPVNYSPEGGSDKGTFIAYIYHFQGTPEPTDLAGYGVFRRGVLVTIDEASAIHEHTLF